MNTIWPLTKKTLQHLYPSRTAIENFIFFNIN
jgi:hypothetical protein